MFLHRPVVIKRCHNHPVIFVIVLASKCETFSDRWVWNWHNITVLYFRKSKEDVYNIQKQKTVIKHDSYKPSVPMDNRELRTNILSSEYFNRKCRRCEKFIKESEYCWRIEKNKWEVYTLQNCNPDFLQLHSSKNVPFKQDKNNKILNRESSFCHHVYCHHSIIVHNDMIRYLD